MNYYRWDTEAAAQTALDLIGTSGTFPVVGKNAASQENVPAKQQTTKWANLCTCLDGKCGFPEISAQQFALMGISQTDQDTFMALSPSIDPYDPDWFSEEE